LFYLNIKSNVVGNFGPESHSFIGQLTNLNYLFLGNTYFVYNGIPDEIQYLTELVELDISYMLWYGSLDTNPHIWKPLTKLESLVMGGNDYNSNLPQELVTLPNLKYLYAEYSNVEGNLDFVAQMPKIQQLWIDQNNIQGTIPASIGSSITLKSFSVTKCNIGGSLPPQIGDIASLEELWVSYNQLTGTIPKEFANILMLERLHMQGNLLEGEMPAELCSSIYPFGRLEKLQADCQTPDGTVSCPNNCCTCCGPTCSDS
jgi:Leucine-rich repeat (LRR) protein